LFDARTGQIVWKRPSVKKGSDGEGPGRGLSADIDPRYPGEECWSYGAGITGLVNIKGEKISGKTPASCNFAIWWDGDELRELLDHTTIAKWNWQSESLETLLSAKSYDCRSNNGTKATPGLQADLFGDWREEVIWPTTDGKELRIFSTTIPTERRIYTLMHDPQYRLSIAWQNVGYNQPPHTSFSIGPKMADPPVPHIRLVGRDISPQSEVRAYSASRHHCHQHNSRCQLAAGCVQGT
jgi:rhamnogalacturonan endolyase